MTSSDRPFRPLLTAAPNQHSWPLAMEIAQKLKSSRAAVTLVVFGGAPSPSQELQARSRGVTLLPAPIGDARSAGEWLWELEARLEPDVVHLNHLLHGQMPWRAPVVATLPADLVLDANVDGTASAGAAGRWTRFELKRSLQAMDFVVAATTEQAARVGRSLGMRPRQLVVLEDSSQYPALYAAALRPHLAPAPEQFLPSA